MTTLVLVRHGQASFGESNYDKLSLLGERQGQLLGEHWLRCGVRNDAVFSGNMQRQRVTAERMQAGLGEPPAGGLQIDPAFDEYDHHGLIQAYLPAVARAQPNTVLQADAVAANAQLFRTFFNLVIDAWMADEPPQSPIAETWRVFRARVAQGLKMAATHGDRVAIVTSGGVITAALQLALGVTDPVVRGLTWRIFNASVHSFHVGRNGLELLGFNDVAHLQTLQDPQLLTRL